jgi:hypothetical protein
MVKCAIIENIFDLSIQPKNPLALKAGWHGFCSTSDEPYNSKAILNTCIVSLKVGRVRSAAAALPESDHWRLLAIGW